MEALPSRVNARIGNEFVNALEKMNVADLTEDSNAAGQANARDGSEVLRDLVHQLGQGNIELGYLFRKKVDLLDLAVHLDAYGVDRPALRRRTGPPRRGRARGWLICSRFVYALVIDCCQ